MVAELEKSGSMLTEANPLVPNERYRLKDFSYNIVWLRIFSHLGEYLVDDPPLNKGKNSRGKKFT